MLSTCNKIFIGELVEAVCERKVTLQDALVEVANICYPFASLKRKKIPLANAYFKKEMCKAINRLKVK